MGYQIDGSPGAPVSWCEPPPGRSRWRRHCRTATRRLILADHAATTNARLRRPDQPQTRPSKADAHGSAPAQRFGAPYPRLIAAAASRCCLVVSGCNPFWQPDRRSIDAWRLGL